MHSVSELWRQIFDEPNHRKEVMVKVNGVEYHENRVLYPAPSVVGKLFDAPSVGNARARTLTLNLMPYDGPPGRIPPMSEIRLYVRLKSADGQRVSEYIQKGVFYADEVKRDGVTGATRITAFDAIMKMERQFGNAVCRITFDDVFGGVQRFRREIGDAMPTPDTPTHEGERFSAWYPNPADTPTLARDMLFTANWARKFTVTFDSGNGTPQTFSVFSGDATPTPTAPTKSGYLFTGWAPTPASTVTTDATYTAQWAGVTSIAITTYPAKIDYIIGDTLDYAGLSVTATYSNGATRDVTTECVLAPVASAAITEVGIITVTASYSGETATFDVTADTATVQSLVIDEYTSLRRGYLIGDTLDYTGLAVYAAMSDGTRRNVTAECVLLPAEGTEVSGAERTGENGYGLDTGFITLTASYRGKTATTELEVADGGWWSLDNRGLLDIHCVGDMPSAIETEYIYYTYPWTFDYIYGGQVKQIYIRDGVTSIGECAFDGCADAETVTIPSSVTTIEYCAFEDCRSLTSVVIPDSVTNIDSYVFFRCDSLISATLPANSSYVSFGMFSDCSNLTNISIPNSVTSIGGCAFSGCTSLKNITIPLGVTEIGYRAFQNCGLTALVLPNSVTTLNPYDDYGDSRYNHTFSECADLKSVILSNQLEYIPYGTFMGCASLENIVIPDSVTAIGEYAFSGCTSLTDIVIPDSITRILSWTFAGCSALTSITIPDSVTRIESRAFYNCGNLTDVYYGGTGNQWYAATRDSSRYNPELASATIHYNSSGPS